MKKSILAVIILLLSISSFAQKLSPDQIIGVWQCEDYKIEVFKAGNTYAAKLLWAKDMFEADGKTPKKDVKNPNGKLRSRSVQGLTHITELVYKDGEYRDGKLYSVQDGNTYSLKGQLKNANSLETRGYKGVPMLGKTYKWKRVE
ncbi:DUF2147 domain-containing protein [Chitinophaga sp. CC14]|uniref:DUF2147 domain-containing protein n=1 Tax=Chitinophaga TaxID=79328 RepID=UPI000DB925E8|nr:DUF2147 domain-containing protein [Chitinophaga ginsengisegetis]MDR6571269.1 uncharacterized protein (DUF2147 family) [Chitinophaga ginsengisegetis]MDR6651003.1 uncharacterized protein (DUF2147 family) [Chitinophaga ginsengisegetis]MDR6657353.1 uncharacterized protein (DUF2147 family) [Chitinophaga ginsengisegetis]